MGALEGRPLAMESPYAPEHPDKAHDSVANHAVHALQGCGGEALGGAVGGLPPAGAALLSRHAGPGALSAYLQHHEGPAACQAAGEPSSLTPNPLCIMVLRCDGSHV